MNDTLRIPDEAAYERDGEYLDRLVGDTKVEVFAGSNQEAAPIPVSPEVEASAMAAITAATLYVNTMRQDALEEHGNRSNYVLAA